MTTQLVHRFARALNHSLPKLGLVLVASLAACVLHQDDPSETAETDAVTATPIIGGTYAAEYPEAGYLNMPLGDGRVGLCSATLISPKTVLTAGHCVDGFTKWDFYLGHVMRSSTRGETYDWREGDASSVNPLHHDIGLVHLDSPIALSSYPSLAVNPVPNGTQAVNVGRVLNGTVTNLLWKAPAVVHDATLVGYPFDYFAPVVIQHGDSGGPVFLNNTHTIIAVNSGANDNMEVLARIDMLASWIHRRIALNEAATGGSSPPDAGTAPPADAGSSADTGSSSPADAASPPPPPSCASETEPNNIFANATTLQPSSCGVLSTATDIDWYRFTATPGTLRIALTASADATFSVGVRSAVLSRPVCLPLATSLKSVELTITGKSRELCLRVSSPSQQRQTYQLQR